ncbi:urease accessory protein UreD [Candidatus Halobonum tyrrellensis]|uniref:Urease accessory protein UreD n=1 Tax=Candidatus Halobonum tyrrellensis G22 TaxID=1324957 RepID=V4HQ96_9EURY|nr:urease accessory protein UreD [Candidatus Halobonum tyrrellensis]ESP90089.1 urease accessory protein UreD [Candidatus Halobonum tyrrellensis G22]
MAADANADADGPHDTDAAGTDDGATDDADDADTVDVPHPAFEPYARETVPQAAVGSPGKDGRLELRFAATSGGTTLVHDYATVPFHLSGTLDYDPHPDGETVFVQSPTGGVAQGDRHEVTVEVGADAVAHVSTGSSTKVQSMTHNYAGAETTLSVGSGGHLDYAPEPTILHADARYAEEFSLDLAAGASAVVSNVVVPGRLARDERFAFERYLSRTRATGPDGPLFADATHLTPAESDPTAPGVLGEFAVYGAAFVVAPDRDAAALSDTLHDAVAGGADGDARAGATELPNGAGVAVRALADRAETVRAALHAAWDRARRELVGAPAPAGRKY